jgi:hypothetical protein
VRVKAEEAAGSNKFAKIEVMRHSTSVR